MLRWRAHSQHGKLAAKPSSCSHAVPPSTGSFSTVYRRTCCPSAWHSPHASQTASQSAFTSAGHGRVKFSSSAFPLRSFALAAAPAGVYFSLAAGCDDTPAKAALTHGR